MWSAITRIFAKNDTSAELQAEMDTQESYDSRQVSPHVKNLLFCFPRCSFPTMNQLSRFFEERTLFYIITAKIDFYSLLKNCQIFHFLYRSSDFERYSYRPCKRCFYWVCCLGHVCRFLL